LAWNRDPRAIVRDRRARSAGAQSALGKVRIDPAIIRPTLIHLADRVGSRMRPRTLAGRTITVRVRFADLRSVTRAMTLPASVAATRTLAEVAEELVWAALADYPAELFISLLAISVSHLEQQPHLQLDLPLGLADEAHRPGTKRGAARWSADRAIDKIRDRFGRDAIGYASVVLEARRSVPDAFRGLAEKEL